MVLYLLFLLPTTALRLCLLLREKGDRSAVDEECELSPADLPSRHPPLSPHLYGSAQGDPQRYHFRLPTVGNPDLCLPPLPSPAGEGGPRSGRSNAYLTAKPRPREKTPHPSAFGCHLLPPEKAYLYPACSCLLLRVAKRHEGTEFHSGGVKEPECARAAARQGDRVAVDEECFLCPTALPSTTPPFALPCLLPP